jgi:sialidase-1
MELRSCFNAGQILPDLGRRLAVAAALVLFLPAAAPAQPAAPPLRKLKDVVVYRDETFYSAFPSIVRRADGELIVAFRRAPDPRKFGNAAVTHTDPCSQLVLVRSKDQGETWSPTPELVFAHPRCGLQDPCMVQLDDQSILCTSYGWALIPAAQSQHLKNPSRLGEFVFLGGVLLRSKNGGRAWTEITLPPTRGEQRLGPFNEPLPAYNRGAMCQGKNGRLFWATVLENPKTKTTSTHLMISTDRGATWQYSCPIAVDDKVTFNETSMYETPDGDLVAFMRTDGLDDHTVVARSTDGGKSFAKWEGAGFQGHPHYALRLPDDRVLLVYGYRHAPTGIRARVLNAECTDVATAPEILLRDDGGSGDLGYPWATMVADNRALVVYYFNQGDGTRFIAGTLLEVGAKK